jgi:hypothetical protein
MIQFNAIIEKFGKQGEKTGWTYFLIPAEIAEKLNKGVKKSYRVKGFLDQTAIEGVAIIPMGEGDFILPLNATLRKQIKKKKNDELLVKLSVDKAVYELNADMMDCLQEEKEAFDYFMTFPRSHQNYYSKWVESAKTDTTKAKRIAKIIRAMLLKQSYAEMIRSGSGE